MTLSFKMGEVLSKENGKAKKQAVERAGFSIPQKESHSGDKRTEGRSTAVTNSRKEEDQMPTQADEILAQAASNATVAESLKKAGDVARNPANASLVEMLAAMNITEMKAAFDKIAASQSAVASATERAAQAAEESARLSAKAFGKSRLEKAEEAGWNGLGVAGGVTLGGVATLLIARRLGFFPA